MFQSIDEVQKELIIKDNQILLNICMFDEHVTAILKVFFQTGALTFSGEQTTTPPILTINGNQLYIKGKTRFPDSDIYENPRTDGQSLDDAIIMKALDLPVRAILGCTEDGKLSATVDFYLSDTWRFSHSFPNLPVEYRGDKKQPWSLDELLPQNTQSSSRKCCFSLATDTYHNTEFDVQLEQGLN